VHNFEIENKLREVFPVDLPHREEIISMFAQFAAEMARLENELRGKFDEYCTHESKDRIFKRGLILSLAIKEGMPTEMAAEVARIIEEEGKIILHPTTLTADPSYQEETPVSKPLIRVPLTLVRDPLPDTLIKDFNDKTLLQVIVETDVEAYRVWVKIVETKNDAEHGIRFVCSLAKPYAEINIKSSDRFLVRLAHVFGLGTE
jgi:hypothetical protein